MSAAIGSWNNFFYRHPRRMNTWVAKAQPTGARLTQRPAWMETRSCSSRHFTSVLVGSCRGAAHRQTRAATPCCSIFEKFWVISICRWNQAVLQRTEFRYLFNLTEPSYLTMGGEQRWNNGTRMLWRGAEVEQILTYPIVSLELTLLSRPLESRTSDLNHDKKAFKRTLSALCSGLKKASSFPELVTAFSELFCWESFSIYLFKMESFPQKTSSSLASGLVCCEKPHGLWMCN